MKIVVGIPTYKRPIGLQRLLNSLSQITLPQNTEVVVVVADNEGEYGQGVNLVKTYAQYPFSLFAIGVSERGISSVRNALLEFGFDKSKCDYLAMVDDDETVEPEWLNALYETAIQTNCDVVGGAIYPEFSETPPSWTERLPLFWRKVPATGRVDLIHGTGSVILSKNVWQKYNKPQFDKAFGLTGGGDKEFFTRIKLRGASFAFAQHAISKEFYDTSRLTFEWALSREYRIGSADVRIMRKHGISNIVALIEVIKFISACLYYSLRFIVFYPASHVRFHSRLKLYRQLGKLNGLSNKPYEEYKNTKGA